METPGEGGSLEVLSEQKALPLPLLFLGYNHSESREGKRHIRKSLNFYPSFLLHTSGILDMTNYLSQASNSV
jgi:hypothetical protein